MNTPPSLAQRARFASIHSRALGAAALALALGSTLGLTACGGGGSESTAAGSASPNGAGSSSDVVAGSGTGSTTTGTTTGTTTTAAGGTTTTTTPPTTTAASTGSTCQIADFAAAALARVNQLRAAGADCRTQGRFAPAPALTWSALLTRSSEAHSQDMAANNFFAHDGSTGSTLATRVDATGYAWSRLGENIAAGYAGLDAVMAGWMGSDGHCANLMNPQFNQIGLVCVPGTATTRYGNYWTMDLALSR
jgi:uncharacterized protein YkwD